MGEPGPETDGARWVADEIRKVKKKTASNARIFLNQTTTSRMNAKPVSLANH